MRTIQDLCNAGYKVRRADDAVDCTEIYSDTIFWAYNQNFHEDLVGIAMNLQPANIHGNGFRIIVAGSRDVNDERPFQFNLFNLDEKKCLDVVIAKYGKAKLAHEAATVAMADSEEEFTQLIRREPATV